MGVWRRGFQDVMHQSTKWKILRGDKVMLQAGRDAGQVGTVLKVIRDPKFPRVVVEGLNLVREWKMGLGWLPPGEDGGAAAAVEHSPLHTMLCWIRCWHHVQSALLSAPRHLSGPYLLCLLPPRRTSGTSSGARTTLAASSASSRPCTTQTWRSWTPCLAERCVPAGASWKTAPRCASHAAAAPQRQSSPSQTC